MRAGLLDGIEAVTFDVGGTLIEPFPSVGHVYADVAREQGIDADPALITLQFGNAWKARQLFGYSRHEWYELVTHSFAGVSPISKTLFDAIYNRFAQPTVWRVFDDVHATLWSLKKRGLKLAIISNWDERLRPLLAELALMQYFPISIISSEIGAHKPDPAIFQAAADQLGISPDFILHVGDSAREDVEGGRAAGMRAVRIARSPALPALKDHIGSLSELLR
jgi:putative hydrolase of the HAD superfamily